jgi:DNA-binding CsgD family transcriptional regulator
MLEVDRNPWAVACDGFEESWAPFFQTQSPALAIDLSGCIIASSEHAAALSPTRSLSGLHHHHVLALNGAACPICVALARITAGALPCGGSATGSNGHRYAVAVIGLRTDGTPVGIVAIFTPWESALEQSTAVGHRTSLQGALTQREMDVLLCLATGLSARETALELGIAHNTARNHIQNVLHKLEVRNRAEAVGRAIQLGIISPGHIGRRLDEDGDRPHEPAIVHRGR